MVNVDAELDDIFGVPQDGSNLDDAKIKDDETHDSAYASVVKDGTASFDDKAQAINTKIESSAEDGASEVEYMDEVPKSQPQVEKEEGLVSGQPKATVGEIISKSLSPESDDGSKGNEMDVEQTSKATDDDLPEVSSSVPEVSSSNEADHKEEMTLTFEKWSLETDDMRFKAFYAEKKKMLPMMLVGGELPFDQMSRELAKAHVNLKDITIEDLELLSEKMYQIQEWRSRVTEIGLRSSRQYFIWKRFIELLRGKLIRIHDVKPAQAREGLFFEHMSDLEYYFGNLEGLYESTKHVTKNLDAAFDHCSRLVTLGMPQRNVARYAENEPNSQRVEAPKKSNTYDDYDGIHDAGKVDPNSVKSSSSSEDESIFGSSDQVW